MTMTATATPPQAATSAPRPPITPIVTPTVTRPPYTGGPPPTTSPRPTPTPPATATPTPVPPPLPTLDVAALRDPLAGFPVVGLAASASTGRLYALVGPGGGALADSVVPLDPATGALETPISVGQGAAALAISNDGRSLYVGSNGRGQIQRLDLAAGRVDRTIDLGPDPAEQPYAIRDLVVVADAPETLAVLRIRAHSTRATELAILRDGATLPRTVTLGLDRSEVTLLACRGITDHVFAFSPYDELRWRNFSLEANGIGVQRASDAWYFRGGDDGHMVIPDTPACLDGLVYGVWGAILGATDGQFGGQIAPAVLGQVIADAPARRLFYLRGAAAAVGVRDVATITIVDAPARAVRGRARGGGDGVERAEVARPVGRERPCLARRRPAPRHHPGPMDQRPPLICGRHGPARRMRRELRAVAAIMPR